MFLVIRYIDIGVFTLENNTSTVMFSFQDHDCISHFAHQGAVTTQNVTLNTFTDQPQH